MDYFTAVQIGRNRVQAAVNLLQEVAGLCYPLLFLKIGTKDWVPVGEEMLYARVEGKNGTAAIVLCDAGGNSKAMSNWILPDRVDSLAKVLESKGVVRFDGDVKLPI